MGVIIPEDEVQLSFVFSVSGISKDITWTLGAKSLSLTTPTEYAQAAYEAITDDSDPRGALYKQATCPLGWAFEGVVATLMTSTGPLVGQYMDQIGAGIGAPDAVPVNCTWLMTKNTALGGRKNRGRAYLPPWGTDEDTVTVAGTILATPVQIMNDSLEWFMEGCADRGLVPCLHHSDGSPGTALTSMVVGTTIATQRRRLR